MASWSTKRKISYLSILFGFIILVVIIPGYFIFYNQPTCYDGKKNGDENGTDCGGSCQLLCSFDAIEPNILWSRSFKVAPDIYSAVAYIENHNINSEAINVPYTFKLYDSRNIEIASRNGVAYIPKNRAFAIFEPNINTSGTIPARTTFEFTKIPVWQKDTAEVPNLVVRERTLSKEDTNPRIDASIENRSLVPYSNIEVVAIVYDGKDNAVGASRTFITDTIAKDQSADVVFTWPAPFETQANICKVPADVMVVIDRSGSMESDGKNPPQPLTDVKNAAILFVNQLSSNDKVGLVSYAGEASVPIDAELTSDFALVKSKISAISIGKDGLQQTNIADGLEKALGEFGSLRHNLQARKVIVALTDGVPTRPLKAGDEKYPETAAQNIANDAKKTDVQLYTIGLGTSVNEDFLKSLATSPDHYFAAVESKNLGNIYKEIATSICKDTPTSIEIIPIVSKGIR